MIDQDVECSSLEVLVEPQKSTKKKGFILPLSIAITGSVLDNVTTEWNLRTTSAIEGNPLMEYMMQHWGVPETLYATKALALLVGTLGGWHTDRFHPHPKISYLRLLYYAEGGMYGAAALWNKAVYSW
jgi:hypothetical protein